MDSKDKKRAYKLVYEAQKELYLQKKQEQYMLFYRYINLKDKENLSNDEKEELEYIKKSLIIL
jgi:dimeric dUTPase (all-alpha-NTP-PPase superfamily)